MADLLFIDPDTAFVLLYTGIQGMNRLPYILGIILQPFQALVLTSVFVPDVFNPSVFLIYLFFKLPAWVSTSTIFILSLSMVSKKG